MAYKYNVSKKSTEWENSEKEKNVNKGKSLFEIPKLMKQSEIAMKRELQDASEQELRKLDQLSDEQIESMKGFEDKEQEYIEKGGAKFRSIKVLQDDMLKNGMKVQINVWDPENKDKFNPYDKILVYKYGTKYYCTGSFWGFDFTDLNDGIYIGDKIICPTWGSFYWIKNGSVDQGPSMRNITSFPLRNRKGFIEAILPDHIPAFGLREMLQGEKMDPRTIVIIGDSEAALSAICTLRYAFVGQIVLIPTSSDGSFQNKDVLIRKFEPIEKEEVYYVEQDLFQKANIEIVNAQISKIDHDNREISFKNDKRKISFEWLLFAGGSKKEKGWKHSNVYVITDYESHAKVYNEVLKSNHTWIHGSTFEAFQLAASIRKQLTKIHFPGVRVTIFDEKISEVEKTLGSKVYQRLLKEYKKNKISIITNADVIKLGGENRLEQISFVLKDQGFKEFYIRPDVIITEPEIGRVDHSIHETFFFDKPKWVPHLDAQNAFKIDKRFSIILNFNNYGMYACGQNALHRSFLANPVIRTTDVKFNIESGFYAALNMLYKEVKMEYIPLTRLTIGDKEWYYFGERNGTFDSYYVEDDLEDDKFIVYYFKGGIITGFLTFGYTNLHLYFIEAMKYLLFPDGKIKEINKHRGLRENSFKLQIKK